MADVPIPFRVADRRAETHDTWTLRLEPAGGDALPAFAPGQFAMLYAFGAGEAPISVAGTAGATLTHTVRSVGAVTRALCAAAPGDVVGVRGPFGTAWPLAALAGRDVVLVAGGLGLPPLRPVLEAILADRDRYGLVSLLYGARTPADLVYAADLESWRTDGAVTVAVTVDAPDETWAGSVGVVTRLVERAAFDAGNTVALICGPEVMMRFTAAALRDRGVAPDAIWVSLERGMTCGTGHCGHCQLGRLFVCKDGPVVRHDTVEALLRVAEL